MSKPLTAIQQAMLYLYKKGEWLAIHEFPFVGTNGAALAARLREARRDGLVCQRKRQGKAFLEYVLGNEGVAYVCANLKEPNNIILP